MGAVVSSDEQQALESELAQAHALIANGEYDEALDRLASARETASELRDVRALGEIAEIARTVGCRAPQETSIADRADALALSTAWALDPDGTRTRVRSSEHDSILDRAGWVLLAVFFAILLVIAVYVAVPRA